MKKGIWVIPALIVFFIAFYVALSSLWYWNGKKSANLEIYWSGYADGYNDNDDCNFSRVPQEEERVAPEYGL